MMKIPKKIEVVQINLELKCAVLNSYNRILDLRKARKDFIFERNFVDFRRIQSIEKKRPREEKELYQKYRVFAKMQTAQDFEDFMDGLTNELRLRQQIQSLQEYLRMGISTLKEAQDYEKEKAQRVLWFDIDQQQEQRGYHRFSRTLYTQKRSFNVGSTFIQPFYSREREFESVSKEGGFRYVASRRCRTTI
jgi:hypothetical protein